MSFTDLLTIAMPCYERKEFFLEALESALNQTVKCKIIVVDNCSSHHYYEKICKIKGVTYYRNETNIGLYPNINRCFELAETEYVKVLDDDDLLSPVYVESFLNAKESYPDIDVFFTDFTTISSKGNSEHKHILPFGYMKKGHKIIEFGAKYKLGFPYMSSVIKKTISQKIFDTREYIGSFDWEWVYSNADSYSFYGNPEKLFFYRIHDNQNTKTDHSFLSLTIPYIYDKILLPKILDQKLRKKVSANAIRALINFRAGIKKNQLKEILKEDNKYSNYLKMKMKKKFLIFLIFFIPKNNVKIINKILKKLSFSKKS